MARPPLPPEDVRRRIHLRCPPAIHELLVQAATEAQESLSLYLLDSAVSRSYALVHDKELLEVARRELRELHLMSHLSPLTRPEP